MEENTRTNRIVGGIVFYVVHVVSKESRRLVLPRASCFCSDQFYSHIFGYNMHLLNHNCSNVNNIVLSLYKCNEFMDITVWDFTEDICYLNYLQNTY
jgi:hypothetical protein